MGEVESPRVATTSQQVKVLPKTSSNQGLWSTVLGLVVAVLGLLLPFKKKRVHT
ncbi:MULTISPECIES: LPXTG cell wall anchor domain-containing protein [Streptococcus]|uniref:LPXTG cell wall anchor domain-containing protein n=1 Tax=Streptococcus TaxID=1301 RepID=UPI0009F90FBF|nr:LPXTG cell wall anchor domain-containing protein [Streptococcus sp. 19428wD3_AN2]TFU82887.1 LPXTG cell wall anchor domain-containing protein [Streptococcus sp. AN2]